jgi:peptide/nickel transport system ATP-binding protein
VAAILEVEDAVVEYARHGAPTVRAVAGVSLSLDRGEIVGLVGESGCGKSSLARAVVGLTPLASGQIRFGDEPVSLSRRTRRRRPAERPLQIVFQNPHSSLNPRRRIGSQLLDGSPGGSRSASGERAGALLGQVGLAPDFVRRFPHEFSGGQLQRIAIARALGAEPAVIVADEVVSGLDASAQAQIANLLRGISRTQNVGLLFISHDLAIVRQIADRVAVMYLGRIVEVGPTEQVWAEPLHPYTQGLIASVPQPDGEGTLPSALPGEVPDPSRPPVGCPLRTRCPHEHDRCVHEPPLFAAGPGRNVACWLRSDSPAAGDGATEKVKHSA